MAKPKKAATTKKAQENGQVQLQPWHVDALFKERVYLFLPALLDGLRTLHEDLEEIKGLLKEN